MRREGWGQDKVCASMRGRGQGAEGQRVQEPAGRRLSRAREWSRDPAETRRTGQAAWPVATGGGLPSQCLPSWHPQDAPTPREWHSLPGQVLGALVGPSSWLSRGGGPCSHPISQRDPWSCVWRALLEVTREGSVLSSGEPSLAKGCGCPWAVGTVTDIQTSPPSPLATLAPEPPCVSSAPQSPPCRAGGQQPRGGR